MSHLPEKGDARRAAEVLDARLRATAPSDGGMATASVNVRTGAITGDDLPLRAAYSDLFDIAEVAEIAEPVVYAFIADIAAGIPPDQAMRSMWVLAVAQGVLMERARWEA